MPDEIIEDALDNFKQTRVFLDEDANVQIRRVRQQARHEPVDA